MVVFFINSVKTICGVKEGEIMKKLIVLFSIIFTILFCNYTEALSLNKGDSIYASGKTIGVRLETGVKINGLFSVKTDNGIKKPWEEAGLLEGDEIIKLDGQMISSYSDINEIIARKKDTEMKIEYKRNSSLFSKMITPCKKENGDYSLGIYVKDRILGVGTLTYVIPDSNIFGALGHSINSSFVRGSIYGASVTNIKKGSRGTIGEKRATFDDEEIGTIQKNTDTGIHGIFTTDSLEGLTLYEIGTITDCKKGPAKILTSINENKIESFDIEIIDLAKQNEKNIKGIKLKVTDKALLEKTNGIVQGMSGSPIIQNGKIIGAVTHVLVNNPEIGYGIYLEWMLEDMDVKIE